MFNELWFKIIFVIIASIFAGILGRLGGRAKDGSWYDCISHSWIRDWLIPLVATGLILYLNFSFNWLYWGALLLHIGLLGGSLTTYFSELMEPDDEVNWVEWGLIGLCYGLSAFFIAWNLNHWFWFLIRMFILALFIPFWSWFTDWLARALNRDISAWGEFGRYSFIIATLPLLLI